MESNKNKEEKGKVKTLHWVRYVKKSGELSILLRFWRIVENTHEKEVNIIKKGDNIT